MWIYTYEDELTHHGIPGMKWGVRRTKAQLSRARKKRSDNYHEDYKKVHDKKSVKYMSDKELRERNNRLNAEKQYGQLTKKSGRGKSLVNAYIAGGTTIAGLVTATAAYKKYGNQALNKIGDWIVNSVKVGGKLTS